jgi:hypothetical protein
MCFLDGLVARIRRSHRRGRGSIPRQGITFYILRIIIVFVDPFFFFFFFLFR